MIRPTDIGDGFYQFLIILTAGAWQMSLHVKCGPSCNLFSYDLTFAQSDKNIIKMFLPVQLSVSTVVLQLSHLI